MFTGNQPYRAIFKKALNPRFQVALLAQGIKNSFFHRPRSG
jgi:hypothetical protein